MRAELEGDVHESQASGSGAGDHRGGSAPSGATHVGDASGDSR